MGGEMFLFQSILCILRVNHIFVFQGSVWAVALLVGTRNSLLPQRLAPHLEQFHLTCETGPG